MEPESLDRLPLPSGRESVFELLCVVRPRRFDALVTFDKPRAGFHGILLEAKSGAQSFADTVHQLKAYRAALKEQLPGPLLVWGVVESGGDRVKPFDAEALRKAALSGNPELGVVIPGTRGIRKIRWAGSGHGKRGGVRVLYYSHPVSRTILFLFAFSKTERDDLSVPQKVALRRIIEAEYP